MDDSEHSNIQSPENTSEISDLVPSQEQVSGHKEIFPDGQDSDILHDYNSESDEDYAQSTATSSTECGEEGELEHEVIEEISEELRILEGENYMMSRLEVAVESMKDYHGKLTKICGAMYSQNKELLAVCKELLQELKRGNASGSNEVPPAKVSTGRGKAKVPVECSSAVRQVHNTLLQKADNGYNDWQLDKRFDSEGNNAVTQKLTTEVMQLYHEKWAESIVRDAIKRYFSTKVEESKRLKEGTNDQHRKTCRRNQRVLHKMSNRLHAIESMDWHEESKEKARAILKDKAYHSSEYSESEDDPDDDDADNTGPSNKKRRIVVQVLPWQRSRLKTIKTQLDEQYIKGLSSRAKGMIAERERSGQSTRQLPQSASKHDWAVRLDNNTSLLDAST